MTWIKERLSSPPAPDVDDEIHASQQQERQSAHTHHIGQRPVKQHQSKFYELSLKHQHRGVNKRRTVGDPAGQ